MAKVVQIDKYANAADPWLNYAKINLDGARMLFGHRRSSTLCFPAATLGHHALEALLKTALIRVGMTIFDPSKIRYLATNVKLDKGDCAWGHNLVALATLLSGRRSNFMLSTPLSVQRIFDNTPLTIRSGLAMFDPFFFELRYPHELNRLVSIGPDDVVVLDALVAVVTPFAEK